MKNGTYYILFDLHTSKYISGHATLDEALHEARKRGSCKVVEQKTSNKTIKFTVKSTVI